MPLELSSQRKSLNKIRENFLLTKRLRKQKRLMRTRKIKTLKKRRANHLRRIPRKKKPLSLIEINNLK